jgi:uncharacterized membrane protein YeaQ/YmgE (transglycosylase-associated protein family)
MGVVMDIVVGLMGALLGGFLAQTAGIAFGGPDRTDPCLPLTRI